MNRAYDWHGRTLQAALTEQPSLSLDFYSYGVMLRKREEESPDFAGCCAVPCAAAQRV